MTQKNNFLKVIQLFSRVRIQCSFSGFKAPSYASFSDTVGKVKVLQFGCFCVNYLMSDSFICMVQLYLPWRGDITMVKSCEIIENRCIGSVPILETVNPC